MDWASITLAALREHRPELVAEAEAAATRAAQEASATAAAEAAAAERARLLAIDDLDPGGHDELVAAAKADGKTTAAELALSIMKAEKAAGSKHLQARENADADAAVPPAKPRTTSATTGSIDEQAKAEWEKDAELRAEFRDNFDSYLAFRKAEAKGTARILRKG